MSTFSIQLDNNVQNLEHHTNQLEQIVNDINGGDVDIITEMLNLLENFHNNSRTLSEIISNANIDILQRHRNSMTVTHINETIDRITARMRLLIRRNVTEVLPSIKKEEGEDYDYSHDENDNEEKEEHLIEVEEVMSSESYEQMMKEHYQNIHEEQPEINECYICGSEHDYEEVYCDNCEAERCIDRVRDGERCHLCKE